MGDAGCQVKFQESQIKITYRESAIKGHHHQEASMAAVIAIKRDQHQEASMAAVIAIKGDHN